LSRIMKSDEIKKSAGRLPFLFKLSLPEYFVFQSLKQIRILPSNLTSTERPSIYATSPSETVAWAVSFSKLVENVACVRELVIQIPIH
jgi:hypothetical protein